MRMYLVEDVKSFGGSGRKMVVKVTQRKGRPGRLGLFGGSK